LPASVGARERERDNGRVGKGEREGQREIMGDWVRVREKDREEERESGRGRDKERVRG